MYILNVFVLSNDKIHEFMISKLQLLLEENAFFTWKILFCYWEITLVGNELLILLHVTCFIEWYYISEFGPKSNLDLGSGNSGVLKLYKNVP